MNLTEMGKQLRELTDQKADLDEQVKEVGKRIQQLKVHDIPAEMEEKEIDKVTIDGVGTIYTKDELYASVLKDDRPQLHQWLIEGGNGDLIVDTVQHQTLKAFIKERLANGLDYPEFVKVTIVPTAQLRRS